MACAWTTFHGGKKDSFVIKKHGAATTPRVLWPQSLIVQTSELKPKGGQVTHRGCHQWGWGECCPAEKGRDDAFTICTGRSRHLLASEIASWMICIHTPKPCYAPSSFAYILKFPSQSLSITSPRMLCRNPSDRTVRRPVTVSSLDHHFQLIQSCSGPTCAKLGQWEGSRWLEGGPYVCANWSGKHIFTTEILDSNEHLFRN